MEFKNKQKIEGLKQLILNELTPLIDGDYALIDVPNHRNIGDNLIWKGELDFLKTIPFKNIYSANMATYLHENMTKNSIILLHGGGNFGDIYVDSQQLRLDIIKQFPKNKIIIFPQTIYFENEEILKQQSELLNQHQNLTICARDNESYKRITKYVDASKIKLLPDMAFCMDLSKHHDHTIKNKLLHMKRVDRELNSNYNDNLINEFLQQNQQGKTIDVIDWPSYSMNKIINKFVAKMDAVEYHLSHKMVKTPILKHFVNDEFGLNSKSSMNRYIQQGITFLNSYDKIATTRLHGFILSVLLDKEVGFIDNSYGKNSTFFNTWMQDFEKVSLLKS
jgi:pyruvyl transferase EpsO